MRLRIHQVGLEFLLLLCCLMSACNDATRRVHEETNIFGPPGTTEGTSIKLSGEDGHIVRIPLEGPYYDARAVDAAKKLQKLDPSSEAWQLKRKALDEETGELVQQLVRDLHRDATGNLEVAFRIAMQTSGPPDRSLIQKALEIAQVLSKILKKRPVSSKVRTVISAPVNNAVIRYMLIGDFERGSKNWSSYTHGERIAIGYYRFEVINAEGFRVHSEAVLVFDNPTKKVLRPIGGQR